MNWIRRKRINPWVLGILIMAVLLPAGLWALVSQDTRQPSIAEGMLDLSDWDPAETGVISLRGEWAFYWQQLLLSEEIRRDGLSPDKMVQVPRVWNRHQIGGENLPGFGYATYHLQILNAPEDQSLSIRMPAASTAFALYVEDEKLASNGRVGTDEGTHQSGYRPTTVTFTPQASEVSLILQVSNFSYARGGLWYPIHLGPESSIEAFGQVVTYRDLFLLGAFFIMALYYLSLYGMGRKEKSNLYFVLLCGITMLRVTIYGDYLITRLIPGISHTAMVTIDYLTIFWFPVVYALLIGQLFPRQFSPVALRAFTAYALFMSAAAFPMSIYTLTSLTYVIQAVLLAISFYIAFGSIKAYLARERDAAFVMTGVLIMLVVGIHDILYHNGLLFHHLDEFFTLGFFAVLFLHALVLGRRFSQALTEAQHLSQQLMKADRLKDEFLANTSHELRTPLNAMISIADSVARGAEGAVNESQKDALGMVINSGRRLGNLINDILDYARIKNADLIMEPRAVNLKAAAESVANVLKRLNRSEKVRLVVDIPDHLLSVHADENRLLQVLYNLVGNAMKFTEEGQVRVSAERTGEMVEICVSDTGIGIPADRLADIFQSFLQLEDSLTRKNKGTGLGLPITKHVVEAHGGKIWVASREGEGSTFCFTLPVSLHSVQETEGGLAPEKLVPYAGTAAEDNRIHPGTFPLRHGGAGPRIMLVDDNEANLLSLTSILKMEGYAITAVTSGKGFFEAFAKEKEVALIILDVMLPGQSGYDICRQVRKHHTVSQLPILMLTARTSTQDIVMGLEAGANDYLPKPFDTEELLARVRILLQLKESVDKAIASELAFLQAQIKPHFLYNAINTFISISRYDVEQARKLLVDFSHYLRRSFDFRGVGQVVSLKQEIELVKAYLEIEKAQHEERLEVSLSLPDDTEARVPILVLQPVVENAIHHGVLPKREGGCVEVSIVKEENTLHFKVADNGTGMEEYQVRRLYEKEPEGGVGLSNINSRLQQLYGAGLAIESSPDAGTTVTWQVPLDPEGSD